MQYLDSIIVRLIYSCHKTVNFCFVTGLHPYNARNGMENRMFDPKRVVCVTNDNGIVTQPPHYNYQN